MKKALALLVLGALLFFTGLLMLMRQTNVVSFVSQVLPDVQNVVLFGAVLQSFGGLLVVYGVVQLLTSKSSKENQAMFRSLMQRVERVEKRIAEVSEKIVAREKPNIALESSFSASPNCRFCGAKIEQGGSFCPNCGRSQK